MLKWAIRLVKILEIILSLFNKTADSFNGDFKEKIELIKQGSIELISAAKEVQNNFQKTLKSADKTILEINYLLASFDEKDSICINCLFYFMKRSSFFGYLFYDSHKTNETKSALQNRLDKALYDVSSLKGFYHPYLQPRWSKS